MRWSIALIFIGVVIVACSTKVDGTGDAGGVPEAGVDGSSRTKGDSGPTCATPSQSCAAPQDCCGAAEDGRVGGAFCIANKCCFGLATGPCTRGDECCSGTCEEVDGNLQCSCIPIGKASGGKEDNCCSRTIGPDGVCIKARPGGSCRSDEDCAQTRCHERQCLRAVTGEPCTHGQECTSQGCGDDKKCACRTQPGTTTCCGDVGNACSGAGSGSCCFAACGGDGKCACGGLGANCGRDEDCCTGSDCREGNCCGPQGAACTGNGDCCNGKCTTEKTCCLDSGRTCTTGAQCCSGNCVGGQCCQGAGEGCANGAPCCAGTHCELIFDLPPRSVCKQ